MPASSISRLSPGAGRPGGPLFDALLRHSEIASRAREEERLRIGGELHNGVCQELLGLACELKALAAGAEKVGCPYEGTLRRAAELVGAAMEASRAVVAECLPAELETQGLGEALRQLTRRTEAQTKCTARIGREFQLPHAMAAQVYRIAQEALRNALRHAGASTIRVFAEGDEAAFSIRVEDDGRGLPPEIERTGRYGLRIMREQAEAIGADLRVENRPGGGTVIICAGPRNRP